MNVLRYLVKDLKYLEHLHLLRTFLGRPPNPDPALGAIEGLFEANPNFQELVLQEQNRAKVWVRGSIDTAVEWEVNEDLWKDPRWA